MGRAPGLQTGYEWEGLRVSRQAMNEGLQGSEQATHAGNGVQALRMDIQTGLQDLRHVP